jgi:glycine cleavage system regulatory protein
MTSLVLTFVGDDRPGLVNAVSEKVADFGGTWLESRSVRLGLRMKILSRSNPRWRSSRLQAYVSRSSAAWWRRS